MGLLFSKYGSKLKWLNVVYFIMCLSCLAYFGSKIVFAGDPSGTTDYGADGSLERLGYSINFTWTLVAAFLVFSMQAGFALLGGFLQAKNMLGYMAHCFADGTIGAVVFWIFGFALMFGGSGAAPGLESGNLFIGYSGFFLAGGSYDAQTIMLWLFQMVFCTKAVTIIAGAVAERMKFAPYLIYSFFVCGIIYPIYGHWMWGGGWLSNLPFGVGCVDFAGSAVVHTIGGMLALVGAYVLGPRKNKYNPDGTSNAIPGHNLTLVVVGTLILAFGWFGFNAGSTLGATDLRIAVVATNTILAAAAGATAVIFMSYIIFGFSDIGLACNGALGGLVAITGPCAYVAPWAAIAIGVIAGAVMWGTVIFVETKLKIDDPLGAVAVHGANGIWGMLALGIFADGTYGGVSGLITGSGGQLLAQFIGVVAAMAWAIGMGALMFYVLKVTMGLRVSELVEYEGVDVHLHGSPCYPAQAELTAQLGPEVVEEEVHRETAILEESLARDSSREKIYSDKLGRWIYAKPKE
jgi:Amt family ammonium transporter